MLAAKFVGSWGAGAPGRLWHQTNEEVRAVERAEVFEKLRGLGAARAVVEFSGGNGEGGAEGIVLYDAGGEPIGEVDGGVPEGRWDPEQKRFVEAPVTPE